MAATLASASLLPVPTDPQASTRGVKRAIACLTMAAAVFRAEVALLLAATGGYLLFTGRTSLRVVVPVFAGSFALSLAISVPVDSYFWQRPLWPELWGFYFNVVEGSSSAWGVSPWHYYFTSALPRLLLHPGSPLLVAAALWHPATRRAASLLVVPSLAFVAVYSAQPHKEARFIIYAVPPLTGAAALGAEMLRTRGARSLPCRLAAWATAGLIPLCAAASTAMLLLSALNYPGADALAQLRTLVAADVAYVDASRGAHPGISIPPDISAHADVLTCMTGLTLFGQNPRGLPFAYYTADRDDPDKQRHHVRMTVPDEVAPLLLLDRTEDHAALQWSHYWERMVYALEEDPRVPLPHGAWDVVGVVHGFAGVEMLRPGQPDPVVLGDGRQVESHGEDNVIGMGAHVARLRRFVRERTGGWWVGPRMVPRIHVMKRYLRGE